MGFITGLISGIKESQVMPVLAYMMALGIDKALLVLVWCCTLAGTNKP